MTKTWLLPATLNLDKLPQCNSHNSWKMYHSSSFLKLYIKERRRCTLPHLIFHLYEQAVEKIAWISLYTFLITRSKDLHLSCLLSIWDIERRRKGAYIFCQPLVKEERNTSFLRQGETEEESLPITHMQVLNKLNSFIW